MNLLAQPWMIKTRNRMRHIGVVRALYKRWVDRFDYEERFGQELMRHVQAGSVVWDVGANVGLYAEKFLARGAARVICVEPAPPAVAALRSRFAGELDSRLTVLPVALSEAAGTAPMTVDGAAPTNQLRSASSAGLVEVPLRRADELIRNDGLPPPTVIKIDVEGYELEVLRGFGEFIDAPGLRAVFIEVHFSLLHERGMDTAADEIVSRLARAGFDVRWVDLSHVRGIRA
jgi:FkbM family methyltransferase